VHGDFNRPPTPPTPSGGSSSPLHGHRGRTGAVLPSLEPSLLTERLL
jgi:hypothetical protein